MPVKRRAVLEILAGATDAERGARVTIDGLASTLEANREVVEAHLAHLVECDLAKRHADGTVRVTTTGEEVLELDTNGLLVVEPRTDDVDP